jgi:hypothetical protein
VLLQFQVSAGDEVHIHRSSVGTERVAACVLQKIGLIGAFRESKQIVMREVAYMNEYMKVSKDVNKYGPSP